MGMFLVIIATIEWKVVDLCKFHRLVISSTLFEHRAYHKVSWISTKRLRTFNQIDHIAISNRYTSWAW